MTRAPLPILVAPVLATLAVTGTGMQQAWIETQVLAGSAMGQGLGSRSAVHGDTLVVGSSGDFHGATVFEDQAGAWTPGTEIPSTGMSLFFPSAVAIEGDVLALAESSALAGGAVYVHERNLGGPQAWGLAQTLPYPKPYTFNPLPVFGDGVALIDGLLFVGAREAPSPPFAGPSRGTTFVYQRDAAGTWQLVLQLEGSAGYHFGVEVDADDGRLAVCGSGFVEIFEEQAPRVWTPQAFIPVHDRISYDTSLELVGNRLLVGLPDYRGPGRAYLFECGPEPGSPWRKVRTFKGSPPEIGDYFGNDVGLSGDTAFVSTPQHDDGRGLVTVYECDAGGPGVWGETARIQLVDGEPDDFFGVSLLAGGGELIVGAPGSNAGGVSDAGSVHVFRRR